MYWSNDAELFDLIKNELYTSVIGDIMDQMGYLNQFLPPRIRPLDNQMVVVGRAFTVAEADIENGKLGGDFQHLDSKTFGVMLEALDDLREGEVYICSGSVNEYALWGELMSTRAIKLGAAGAVVNGYSRDTKGILKLNFPTFSFGCYARDQAPRGKVVGFRQPIQLGTVHINPGDMVIGDMDGVCIVPQAIEKEVFCAAIEKARGEKMVQIKMMEGMGAKEAFDKYKIM